MHQVCLGFLFVSAASVSSPNFTDDQSGRARVVNTQKPLQSIEQWQIENISVSFGFREGDHPKLLADSLCFQLRQSGSPCTEQFTTQVENTFAERIRKVQYDSLGSRLISQIRNGWYLLRESNEGHEAMLQFVYSLAALPASSFLMRELISASLWPSKLEMPSANGTWYSYEEMSDQWHVRQLELWETFSSARYQPPLYNAIGDDIVDAGAAVSHMIPDGETEFPAGFPVTCRHRLSHDLQLFEYLNSHGFLSDEVAKPAASAYRAVLRLLDVELFPPRNRTWIPEALWVQLYPFYNRRIYVHHSPRLSTSALSPIRKAAIWHSSGAINNPDTGGALSTGGVLVVDNLLTPEALAALRDFAELSTIYFQDRASYLGAARHTGLSTPLLGQIAEELRQAFPDFLCDLPLANLWAFKFDDELQSGINVHADTAAINVNLWITPDNYNMDPQTGGAVIYDARVDQSSAATFDDYNAGEDYTMRDSMLQDTEYSNVTIPYRQNRAIIFDSARLHKTQDFQFKSAGIRARRINVTFLFGARGGYCTLRRRLLTKFVPAAPAV